MERSRRGQHHLLLMRRDCSEHASTEEEEEQQGRMPAWNPRSRTGRKDGQTGSHRHHSATFLSQRYSIIPPSASLSLLGKPVFMCVRRETSRRRAIIATSSSDTLHIHRAVSIYYHRSVAPTPYTPLHACPRINAWIYLQSMYMYVWISINVCMRINQRMSCMYVCMSMYVCIYFGA